ncbi:MAG: DUF983 domain-containing protein [Alphaproteobacteria bacterium]
MTQEPSFPRRTVAEAVGLGLSQKCPRCGSGSLYQSFLKVRSRCESCDLDLSREDSGDGPAAFLIFGIGGIVLFLALVVELAAQPPYWVHFSIWLPLVLLLFWFTAPRAKAIFIAMQFHNKSSDSGSAQYK